MGQVNRTNFGNTKVLTLTNAQILALATTPVVAIPAIPSAIIVPLWVWFHLHWVADFTNIDANANLFFDYANGESPQAFTGLQEMPNNGVSNLLGNGASVSAACGLFTFLWTAQNALTGTSGFLDSDILGQPITIGMSNGGSGNLTGGNAGNTLQVSLFYNVIRP